MKTITIAALAACLSSAAWADTAPRADEIDAARITQVMEHHFTVALARDGQHQALSEARVVMADLNRDVEAGRRVAQAYAAATGARATPAAP